MLILGVLFLRSVVGALLLILPVLLAVYTTCAFIGYAGIQVGLGTSIFASIAIGVGIDFAIHYLWRYRSERRRLQDHWSATQSTLVSVGKVILFNALIISGGFVVLLFAATVPPQQIGIFVALTVITSLVATLIILSGLTSIWQTIRRLMMADPAERPDWVSEAYYPFNSNFHATEFGPLHYIDEGTGDPLVLVHGNPSWSFEFRHLVNALSKKYRCIAVDHIGFGLSAKPTDARAFHPRQHAGNLEELVDHLGLSNITLVLSDWGGPIGLNYAIRHPQRVARLVLFNTWAWPVAGDPHYEKFSRMMGGRIGRFLIKRLNFFVNGVMKKAAGDRSVFTAQVMRHYRKALPNAQARAASAALPGYIIGATDWLQSIWEQRRTFTSKPALVIWGSRDIAFREQELERWRTELTRAEFHVLPDKGHFIAEEAAPQATTLIERFIQTQPHAPQRKESP